AKWNYRANEADLERLRNDVAAARAEARLAQRLNDPNRQRLSERQEAAERRRGLPKPDVSPPGPSSDSHPSREEMLSWTPQQWMTFEQKHGKPAVDRLVRGLD